MTVASLARFTQLRRASLLTSLALLVACSLTLSCGYSTRVSDWPSRGALICVRNDLTDVVRVSAVDEVGRSIEKLRLSPGSRAVFRWPFIAAMGQIEATIGRGPHSRTYITPLFDVWAADHWTWHVTNHTHPVQDGIC